MDPRNRYVAEVEFTEEGTNEKRVEYMRFDGTESAAGYLKGDWYSTSLHLRLISSAVSLFGLIPAGNPIKAAVAPLCENAGEQAFVVIS